MSDGDPTAEQIAEIDRRSQALRDDHSNATMDRLWRKVYALERWSFLVRDQDNPHPVIATLPQGEMLMAFTTKDRAREGDLALGLDPDANSLSVSVPLPAAIEWAAGFADHHEVFGIVFDYPTQGYFMPLRTLVPTQEWMAANPPL